MNRDRQHSAERRPYRLRVPTPVARVVQSKRLDLDDVAPWVIATVRAWPRSADDRQVAAGIGVQPRHVQLARHKRG